MHHISSIVTPKPSIVEQGFNGSHTTTSSDSDGIGFEWTSTGAETPNFHKRKRDGLLPANSYDTTKLIFEMNDQSGSAVSANGYYWGMGAGSGMESAYLPGVRSGLINEIRSWHDLNYDDALQVAITALATRYFDLGTFLGELRETIAQFRGLTTRFLNLATKYNVTNLANAWLEIRYAWRPLWSDIQSFVEALAGAKSPVGTIYKERKGDESTKTVETSTRIGNVLITRRILSHLSIRATAETMIEPARFRTAPLSTAWELVTFSFIVDWFLSVGSALVSLEASVGFPDLQTSGGFYHTFSVETELSDFVAPGWTGSFTGYHKVIGYQRSRFALAPSYIPQFQFNMDMPKLLDLILITLKLKKIV